MNQPAGARDAQRPVQHHPHRRTGLHARQAAGQHGIVRLYGPDPDQDGIALRAQQMHACSRGFAGHRDRLAAGPADLVIGRHRQLEDHMRTLVADAPEMPGMIVRGFLRAEPDIDCYAAGVKPGVALPGYFRIGILDRRHHARDPGGPMIASAAGRRLADMRARLQRHIERGAAGGLAGLQERHRLGMRAAAGLGPAAPTMTPSLTTTAPTAGLGQLRPCPRRPSANASCMKRWSAAKASVICVTERAARRHRRMSSPSTASKSLASRKLR